MVYLGRLALLATAALVALQATDAQQSPSSPFRGLKEQADCTCKDGLKACLFVHGLGLATDGPVLSSYPKCFGTIEKQAKCCSSVKFMQMNTVNNAWYGDTLSKKVCDQAISMAKAGSNKMALEGIALIGHSMGNLIIANAERKGFCGISKTASKWISLAGPIFGSKSSNLAVTGCVGGGLNQIILSAAGQCPAKESVTSMVYKGSSSASAALNGYYDEVATIYRNKVTSNMCGTYPTGLPTTKNKQYGLISSLSKHDGANDGAVSLASCQGGLADSKYTTKFNGGNFYKATINHVDASLTATDGSTDDKKPIAWFNCQF